MNVLVITGDKNFKAEHPRYELQRAAVERLEVVPVVRGGLMRAYRQLLSLRGQPFDVVTSQDPFWRGLMAWHVSWHMKARLSIQVHADLHQQNFIKHVLSQIVLRHADSIRVVTEKIKSQIEHIGVKAKISVLPAFVNLAKFRNLLLQPHTQKIVLWIGRFEPEKDPVYALEIAKSIPQAKLIMLGSGSLESVLREKAKNINVEFSGWQDPAKFLETADVVLSTSLHESYGMSIIESLAAGVPVVAPDVGIAREAGAIVVPRNQLADAVVTVLREGTKGELKIPISTSDEWTKKWLETL